jgi:GAF domain-containing protein
VAATVDFPHENGGVSLTDMAQRDLDAALQLLADGAQYITGASGAAIALRRDGRDDMLCRASVGSNAPELGALLSTEFGLSGESVRTRRMLRCDDAERDVRVNREVCRQMGISSVLVMPMVDDDQVLGVFELFSGKANAFGDRDLSAVQRLSQMVESAVRMAYAADRLPEQLSEPETSVAEAAVEGQDLIVEDEDAVQPPPKLESVGTLAAAPAEAHVIQATPAVIETGVIETGVTEIGALETSALETSVKEINPKASSPKPQEGSAVPAVPAVAAPANVPSPVNTPLLGSAQAAGEGEAVKSGTDPGNVPPVLRKLRKCEDCGFPISAGRILCLECEDKKWREQLWPQQTARKPPAGVVAVSDAKMPGSVTAAAASMAKTQAPAQDPGDVPSESGLASTRVEVQAENYGAKPRDEFSGEVSPGFSDRLELILTGCFEPSRTWFSAHRYVVLPLLAIGIAVTVFLLVR